MSPILRPRGAQIPRSELDNEALVTAQWAAQSSTAAAVQQLGVRLASGGDAMAALVRDSQDTAALWRDRDRALIAEMSKPANQQSRGGIDALRKQIAQLEDKQKTLQAKIETDFPDYAALSSPRPLNVDNVQKLLGADEALAFFLAGDKESYVFALTHDAFDWRVIPLTKAQLSDKVAAFRRGLDVDALNKSIADGKPVLFNLDTAYRALFAAVATGRGHHQGQEEPRRRALGRADGAAVPFAGDRETAPAAQ